MKTIFSIATFLIAFSANAMELPQYENAKKITGPDKKNYVDAIDAAFVNKKIECEMNYRPLQEKARQNMIKTVGDRLTLIYQNKSDLATMYQMEDNNPGIVIATSFKNNGKSFFDELSFHLSPDSTQIRSFEFNYYEVNLVRVNEGSILNPQIVQKQKLSQISAVRCTVD